jgi:hypothetical protein
VHESLFQKPEQAFVEDHMKPIFQEKKIIWSEFCGHPYKMIKLYLGESGRIYFIYLFTWDYY